MGRVRTTRAAWVEAGLQALTTGGIAAVRVESLAKNLGVTKGGFYGYFADREALLDAMLDLWERESVHDVLERVESEPTSPRARARQAGALTFSNDRLLAIDLAIRSWARNDRRVAARLQRVDNQRMAFLRESFSGVVSDPAEVEARSFLAFCAAIGQHFLAAEHAGRSRAEVFARAADLVFTTPNSSTRPQSRRG